MPKGEGVVLGGKPVELADLKEVARALVDVAKDVRIWVFNGEMGSGKTTLIKAVCTELGVERGMSSPTFSIVNEYKGDDHLPIYHFDFYRLEKESEAYDMGIEEYFDSGSYCFIEWAERVPSLLPSNYLKINITLHTQTTRKIEYIML